MPQAREGIPTAWQQKLVRQTPWERFAQSKGIGKHKRADRDGLRPATLPPCRLTTLSAVPARCRLLASLVTSRYAPGAPNGCLCITHSCGNALALSWSASRAVGLFPPEFHKSALDPASHVSLCSLPMQPRGPPPAGRASSGGAREKRPRVLPSRNSTRAVLRALVSRFHAVNPLARTRSEQRKAGLVLPADSP